MQKNGNSAVLAAENMQRNESEPLLDLKNTRSAKHVEICLPAISNAANNAAAGAGDAAGYRMRSSAQRKDRPPKDRYSKDRSSRSDDFRLREMSETGSTEYSETGVLSTRFFLCNATFGLFVSLQLSTETEQLVCR